MIHNENCLDTMERLSDNHIDLTVTSPPYDNLRDYKGYTFDFESIAKELYRVTKEGGVVVWVVGDATINGSETGTSFKQALYFKEIGFKLHDTMIYEKAKQPANHNRYEQGFEYMFVFVKGKLNTFNPIKERKKYESQAGKEIRHRGKTGWQVDVRKNKSIYKVKNNIWEYYVGSNFTPTSKLIHQHPAVFPLKLAKDHIISWSNEGDLVYDCFMGSGTTAIACIQLDRKFIGSEISEEYCKIANKRIEYEQQKLRLL